MTAILEIRNLSLSRGGKPVLHDLSLSVGKGQISALLGANGAGKSSLVLGAAGMIPLSSGSVEMEGEDLAGRQADSIRASGLAAVPEGHHVLAGLTVQENLEVAGATQTPVSAAEGIERAYAVFSRTCGSNRSASGFNFGRPATDGRAGAGHRQPAKGHSGRRDVTRPGTSDRQTSARCDPRPGRQWRRCAFDRAIHPSRAGFGGPRPMSWIAGTWCSAGRRRGRGQSGHSSRSLSGRRLTWPNLKLRPPVEPDRQQSDCARQERQQGRGLRSETSATAP